MEAPRNERQKVPWLVWVIVVAGVLVPWLSAAGVKIYLDKMGQPTWPWSTFELPIAIGLGATLYHSLPFLFLAFAAYKLLPRVFAGLVTLRSRQIFFGGGLVVGLIGAVIVFTRMFWVFEYGELLTPAYLAYLPYMLVGLGIGYVAGRWTIH